MIESSEKYHSALASPSRRRVLDALMASPEPLDAASVAAKLGLHLTTARFHLDQLTAAGLTQRQAGTERRRGRPRLLYRPAGVARDEDARQQLIGVLAAALGRENDPAAAATRAGRTWGESFELPESSDPTPGLVDVLERLGFDPEPGLGSDEIRLTACPFRDIARDHPTVVCGIHGGLIEKLLDDTTFTARLMPLIEPELCLLALHRL